MAAVYEESTPGLRKLVLLSLIRSLLSYILVLVSDSDFLVGLVVKASASRVEDPVFESRLRRDFSGVESYQRLQNWHSRGYRIKHFGQPVSVTWPVYRNVNDEESSFGIGLKGMNISSVSSE